MFSFLIVSAVLLTYTRAQLSNETELLNVSSSCPDTICDYISLHKLSSLLSLRATVTFSNHYTAHGTAAQQAQWIVDPHREIIGWNAGAFAPQYVQLDLNQKHTIYCIRLHVEQCPPGETIHHILVGADKNHLEMVREFNFTTLRGDRLVHTFIPPYDNVRYIQIKTLQSPSWVAWINVQVYGASMKHSFNISYIFITLFALITKYFH
ncbi:unnamed protein product [Didymodactylos carnosus]|uniref:F5/8 type C domain-containing protein n=1 Tax=Didymodactylos carnosus TaxID=1234261 RepID=A0A813ZGU4_9BILA|nr:unnamed protein product [Didymodactylos carnosus]CAF3681762.1 unnamed protein product [Didymodactylos carnosus]